MPVVVQMKTGKIGRQLEICLCMWGVAEGSRTTGEPWFHLQVIGSSSKPFQQMFCAEFASFFSPSCNHMDAHLCSKSWGKEPKHNGLVWAAELLKRLKSKRNFNFCLWTRQIQFAWNRIFHVHFYRQGECWDPGCVVYTTLFLLMQK